MHTQENKSKNVSLSKKERLFVAEYLVDYNATAAAKRAGYAESTALGKAPGWVGKSREASTKPHVYDAIHARMGLMLDTLNISADMVLEELAVLGFVNMADLVEWGPDGVRVKSSAEIGMNTKAVAQIKETRTVIGSDKASGKDVLKIVTEIKLHDKLKALTKLGDHLGLFTQKVELTGKDGGPIQHQGGLSSELQEMLDDVLGHLGKTHEVGSVSDNTHYHH